MPGSFFHFLFIAMWLAFLVYWAIAARHAKPMRWREGGMVRILDTALFFAAAILFAADHRLPAVFTVRFMAPSLVLEAAFAVATATGLGFAVWARRHLGQEWSPVVALKEEQTLIRGGPYRFVRHPIYSGMLLALLATGLAIGEWRAVLGFLAALIGILRRVKAEEAQLRAAFPDYDRYCAETAALIPRLY